MAKKAYSWSLKRVNSSSPTLTGDPPNCAPLELVHLSHLPSTHLRNQNPVANLHGRRNPLSITVKSTRSNSEDLSLRELLDGILGEEDAGGGLGLGLHALDENAVEERLESLDVAEGSGLWGR